MKRKVLIILAIVLAVLIALLAAAYFGIRSTFSSGRENGANLRAEAFAPEYNAVEIPVEQGFMTTVAKDDSAGYHIFFLHGGGCVMDAVPYHTDVICALADKGLKLTAYDYPLFPETDYVDICDAVFDAYLDLKELYPEDKIALYGDSAGGALALHLLMRLRDEGMEVPEKTILVSPMLDLSVSNPDIELYADGDISLDHTGAKILSFYMAGLRDPKSPELSPLYGDLTGLGDLLMFYGEREILRPDCEVFLAMFPGVEGTTLEAHMGSKKYHDYVMIVTDPESVIAFDRMAEFVG